MNRSPDEEEQADAHLEMLNRAGKFVIRWMKYPNASYLSSSTEGQTPKFGASHRDTPTFDTYEEAIAHRATWVPLVQMQTKVVILTKDGGFTVPTTGLMTEVASYDIDGAWAKSSEGWPEVTTNARDMYVFANCVTTIPYGSYVFINDSCLRVHPNHIEQLKKDFKAAGNPTSQDSITRRGGQLKAPKWWTDDETIDEQQFTIAGWTVTFTPQTVLIEKPGSLFTGFAPVGIVKDMCLEYARVAQRYRSCVALAQELSSSPSPERVQEIRVILGDMQADAENL